MFKFRKRVLILLLLGMIFVPLKQTQAASHSTQYYNTAGTRFTLKVTIDSVYPNDGSNSIYFETTLDQLRPDALDVHDLTVFFRVSSYFTDGGVLPALSYVGDESSGYSSFDYDSSWGDVNLQISVSWREDIPLAIDPEWSVGWSTYFTLQTGSFISDNYYIFIIIAVIAVGLIGIAYGVQRSKKQSQKPPQTIPVQIQPQTTYSEQSQPSHKVLMYCPNCESQLKEITQFCPDCGASLS